MGNNAQLPHPLWDETYNKNAIHGG